MIFKQDLFRLLDRSLFGQELAEQQRDIGHDDDADDQCCDIGVWQKGQHASQQRCQESAGAQTGQDTGQRDADLSQ